MLTEKTTNNNNIPVTINTKIDNGETVMSIEDETIKIEFNNIGEGLCGDYNPNNPNDINLLRFDAYVSNPDGDKEYNTDWLPIDDASYCTRLPVNTPIDILKKKIKHIHTEYRNKISSYEDYLYGPSVKKLGESLSWICN